jgi:hypothetical protein
MSKDTLSTITGDLGELDSESAELLASWKAAKDDGAEDANDDDNDDDEPSGEDDEPAEEETEESTEEEETEETEEPSEEEEPRTKVQKRIDQLTAKSKTLEAENAGLKTALQNASGIKPGQPLALVPLPEDPLSYLVSDEAVEEALSKAQNYLTWAKKNRNGATVQTENGPVEMDAEDVEAFREEQEAVLLAAPKRKAWITEYTAAHAAALQAYPKMFVKDTPENAFVAQIIKAVPGLARHPKHEQIIGDLWMGRQLREGKMKAVKADPAQKAKANGSAATSTAKSSLSSSASIAAPARKGAADKSAITQRAFSGEMDPDEAVSAMLASRY